MNSDELAGQGAAATKSGGVPITNATLENGHDSLSAFYESFRQLLATIPVQASNAAPLYFTRITTPLGPMLAAATGEALCLLEFMGKETQLKRIGHELGCTAIPGVNAVLQQTERELAEYFAGKRMRFDVPLRLVGSDFQQQAWRILLEIPCGETRSYGGQARKLGRPEAVRAVAGANGDNRIAIIIPCHRVIGANGKLTGYGGGLERKRWLLDHELRIAPLFTAGLNAQRQ